MKVVIACAGTGGHINPGIAIANIIKEKYSNPDILFIGSKQGLENELVKKAGYNIVNIRTGKLIRSLTLKNIKGMYNAYAGIRDSNKILKEFKPDIVIGTGGYICVPVMTAAKKLKIPYMLHESNAFPGLSVKMLAKKAKCVMIGFEDAKERLKNRNNIMYTGTPSKFNTDTIQKLDYEKSLKELGLTENDIGSNRKIVLVTGGSQGAMRINNTVIDMVKKYKDENIFFVLAVGHKNYDSILAKIKEISKNEKIDMSKYIKIEKYIYDMEIMYKVCDLCITRAGAMTIIEHVIAMKPSILIPLPTAAENHQLYNAKVLENLNAAKILEEKDMKEETLHEIILSVLNDDTLSEMSRNTKSALNNNVEEKIYECIDKVYKKTR